MTIQPEQRQRLRPRGRKAVSLCLRCAQAIAPDWPLLTLWPYLKMSFPLSLLRMSRHKPRRPLYGEQRRPNTKRTNHLLGYFRHLLAFIKQALDLGKRRLWRLSKQEVSCCLKTTRTRNSVFGNPHTEA
jgi:hypothetical protein